MTKPESHWILGLVYINLDDPRVLVPVPYKLGWAVNFGNPRAVTAMSWIWGFFLLALTAIPIAVHPASLSKSPPALFVLIAASLAALGMLRLNGSFVWSDYRFVYLTSYGLVAASAGFGVQGLINGPLVLWWGVNNLSWAHHLVLAPVAAAAQTFGKWSAILLILKVRPTSGGRDCIRYGLLVGLGFTIVEIAIFYFRVAWAEASWSYLGLWERISASMFHIYSGGLVAIAVWTKRPWLLVLVVVIHASMDYLAGIGGLVTSNSNALEGIFSVLAVVTWVAFLLVECLTRSVDSVLKQP